jgi:predicted metal-dependent hydrolase
MKLQKLTKIVFYLSLMGWFPFMWLVLISGDSSELVRVILFLSGFLICLASGFGMTNILSDVDLFKSAEEFIKTKPVNGYGYLLDQKETMIEFAILHCEAQKKAIKLKIEVFLEQQGMSLTDDWELESTGNTVIDEAYPLTNIK